MTRTTEFLPAITLCFCGFVAVGCSDAERRGGEPSGAGGSVTGGASGAGGASGGSAPRGESGAAGRPDASVGSGAGGARATGGASGSSGASLDAGDTEAGAAPGRCGPQPSKRAPPLPPPAGPTIEVDTVEALMNTVDGVADGTTILIEDGTYYLPGLLRFRNGVRDITLRSKSGDRDRVILDGSQSSSDEMIWFEESENVTVADITVQNADVHCFTIKGESDAQGVHIYNCRIRNCWQRYVKGTAPFDPATRPAGGRIEFCSFEQDGPKQQDDLFDGDYIGGIDMMWLDEWVIADNEFDGIQGRNNQGRAAIFIWNNSEDVTVERNRIVRCDTGIAFGNPSGEPLHMTRGILRNNMVTRGSYKAIELARTQDVEVYNNTVWSQDTTFDRAFHSFQGSDGIHVFNNLVRAARIRVDDSGATVEANRVGDLDGELVDPDNGDLHLTVSGAAAALGLGSPIPAGVTDFDGDPRGEPPAVGADECMP